MSDNVLETIQKILQDVIAPQLRELSGRVDSLTKELTAEVASLRRETELRSHAIDQRFNAVDQRFNFIDQGLSKSDDKHDAQFKAIMAQIGQVNIQAELVNTRTFAALSERVAVLEARPH